jgi:arsenate reductase
MGVKLCRPSEVLLDFLLQPQKSSFTKEDGEQGVDVQGKHLL